MRRLSLILLATAAVVAAATGCDRDRTAAEPVTVSTTPNGSTLALPASQPPVEFGIGTVTIRAGDRRHTVRVEVAETAEQRERGLMFRTSMPDDAGMIFIYPNETPGGFWMYNTLIPLSIAFARTDGTVFQTLEMEPCRADYASMCPSYPARLAFRYALEMNAGWFTRNAIEPGAEMFFQRD